MRKFLLTLLIGFAIVGCQKEDFSDELAEVNGQIEALEGQIDILIERAREDAELARILQAQIDAVRSELSEMSQEIVKFKDLIDGGQSRIVELLELLEVRNAEADSLEIQIEELRLLLEKEEITNTEYLDRLIILESELEEVRNTVITVINEVEVEVIEYLDTVRYETITDVVTNVTVNTVTNVIEVDVINDIIVNETITVTNVIVSTDTVTVIEYVDNIITEVNTVTIDNVIETIVTEIVTVTTVETITVVEYVDNPADLIEIQLLQAKITVLEYIVSQLRKDNLVEEISTSVTNEASGSIPDNYVENEHKLAFRYDPYVGALWIHSGWVGAPVIIKVDGVVKSSANGKINLPHGGEVVIEATQDVNTIQEGEVTYKFKYTLDTDISNGVQEGKTTWKI